MYVFNLFFFQHWLIWLDYVRAIENCITYLLESYSDRHGVFTTEEYFKRRSTHYTG
jgi:hypothetical protein